MEFTLVLQALPTDSAAAGADPTPEVDPRSPRRPRSRLRTLAIILLVVDAVLLAANVAHLAAAGPDRPATIFSGVGWNGDLDGSYIEIFGALQLVAAAAVLVFLAAARRSAVYAAWALALVTLIADDVLQIHERVGGALAGSLDLPTPAGLRAQDVGELVVWAAEGAVLGLALIVTYFFAARRDRRNAVALLACVGLLAVFAVGLDQLHALVVPHVPLRVDLAMSLLETAGELVGMTLILLVVVRMAVRSVMHHGAIQA